MIFYDSLKGFFRFSLKHTGLVMTSLSVLIGIFVIFIFFFVFFQNIKRAFIYWGNSFQLSIYLKPLAKEKEILNIKNILNSKKEIKKVTFISKEKAMKKFMLYNLNGVNEMLSYFHSENPLPASFEVELKESYLGINQKENLKKLSEYFSTLKGVEDVSYGGAILEKYEIFFRSFYRFSLLFMLILLLGGLFIINNMIRASLDQRKEEIEILTLIGSTHWNIQRAFFFEGGLMGFLASSIAALIGFLFFSLQMNMVSLEFKYLINHFHFKYLSIAQIFFVLLVGFLVGLFGSFISTKKIFSQVGTI